MEASIRQKLTIPMAADRTFYFTACIENTQRLEPDAAESQQVFARDVSAQQGNQSFHRCKDSLRGPPFSLSNSRPGVLKKGNFVKLFDPQTHLYRKSGILDQIPPSAVTQTYPEKAMMHADNLVLRAREGDGIAQGKLMQVWYKRIYNFGFKFFYDHDLAMEVAQKTFIAMHRNMINLQDPARFRSWLYTIAVNCCREELRRRKNNRSVSLQHFGSGDEEESKSWETAGQRQHNPERMMQQTELSELLHASLKQLSEEQREVVVMKEYEGLKFREIAEVLNISENTVKSRMYYGLEALKRILERRNITRETIGYEL